MYDLKSVFDVVDVDTGEIVEVSYYEEVVENDFGNMKVNIHNRIWMTARSEMLFPSTELEGHYYCKNYDPPKFFRVPKS
ncbi:hypothetical protein [Acinetobacter baumannii]|uniref:hypothetical protein n=1 Tax=Acinetobacter baumannii TaxID=470 RepID=UPI00344D9908